MESPCRYPVEQFQIGLEENWDLELANVEVLLVGLRFLSLKNRYDRALVCFQTWHDASCEFAQ